MAKINIKNPITIFNKVEEINGVPIEISTLDNALLVAENEGKVYKCDNKLYEIVVDSETKSLIDLTGATIKNPSGFSIPKGYGYFNVSGNVGRSLTSMETLTLGAYAYNIYIGYDKSLYAWDDYLLIISNNSSGTWGNDRDLYFKITGGVDATNKNLIKWFTDINATIEGGTWISETYLFQEILSPSGTLDVTANGEVDVKSYEKVNVNVPEVPVWDGTVEDYVSEKIIYVYEVFGQRTYTFNVGNASTYGDITFPCYEVNGSHYLKTASNGGLGIYLHSTQVNDNVYHIYTGSLSDEVEFTDSIENGVTLYCTGAHTGGTNE